MQARILRFICVAAVISMVTQTSCISAQDATDRYKTTQLSVNSATLGRETRQNDSHSPNLVFLDGFEYGVSRNGSSSYSRTRNPFVQTGGWAAVKAENVTGDWHGYLYTVSEIPGYKGDFPGRNSTSVLAIESLPDSMGAQTDFYLQYGTGTVPDTVPANVWFQFWIYSNHYDDPTDQNDQLSAYDSRFKFI